VMFIGIDVTRQNDCWVSKEIQTQNSLSQRVELIPHKKSET